MPEMLDDSQRHLRLHSPLGGDLAAQRFGGTEEMGRLFQFDLDLVSNNPDLKFEDIVGQRVTLELDLEQGVRYFDGFVTEFQYLGMGENLVKYHATVRPWLWFLTRTADCRIFQKDQDGIRTVPDIIKKVFSDNGMTDVEFRLNGSYRDWVYCVQYRETDFNFVSRLMEQEGIYYFFEHDQGKHVMVLADDIAVHQPFPDHDTIPFQPLSGGIRTEELDHVSQLTFRHSVQPAKYSLNDFDFENPTVGLLARNEKTREHAAQLPDSEIYDYPGEYKQQKDGDAYANRRLEELQSQFERVFVSGPCRVFASGCKISLADHPRADRNCEYLVVSVSYDIGNSGFGAREGEAAYANSSAELMDTSEIFRSARITAKPVVQGCQTAIVVGPESEEIYCNELGCVKVQFHWDRYGNRDQDSSCWMRASQYWAGNGRGSMHIPRIGDEVLVSFLEGDPDQPIITGRVYHAVNKPPYELPGNKTQSGIKSRSTPGGSANNFNELRFEDKKGKEEVYFQAEKNLNSLVKNSETRKVGNKRTTNIGTGRSYPASSGGNVAENTTVHADRKTEIKGNDCLDVATDMAASDGRIVTVHNGDHKLEVKLGNQETKALLDIITESQMGNITRKAPLGSITHEALTSIELKCGASSITLNPGGVTIKGPMVNIEGTGIVNIKGGVVKIN